MNWKNRLNSRYVQISGHVILTIVLLYIILKIIDNVGPIMLAVGSGLRWLNVLIKPLFWGIVLAYILYPLMKFVQRQLERIPPVRKQGKSMLGLATAITMIGVALLIVLLFSLLISALTRDLRFANFDDIAEVFSSLIDTLNSFYQALSSKLSELNISSSQMSSLMQKLSDAVGKLVQNFSSGLLESINNLQSFFTNLLFAIIFAIYFLLDARGLARYWNRVLAAFSSKRFARGFHTLISDIDRVFSGYIRGQLLDAVFMGVVVSIVLSLMKVRFAVIIGVLTGIGNLIPYVGPFVAYGSTIIVCLVNGDLWRMVYAMIALFFIQTIDGNVINPKLLAGAINIHPMLVIASLIIGSRIGGIVGMLFAVPVAALIKIQFDRLISYILKKRHMEQAEDTSDEGDEKNTGSGRNSGNVADTEDSGHTESTAPGEEVLTGEVVDTVNPER